MKILFVVEKLMLSEPLGVMQLSSICRQQGHSTRLVALTQTPLVKSVRDYRPDIIAYSTMTPNAGLFREADQQVLESLPLHQPAPLRIMGGPHPTYFPEILTECRLDAICIGEGDRAILKILDHFREGQALTGILNVVSRHSSAAGNSGRELIEDLDALPWMDRAVYYEAVPHYQKQGLRSVLTSRGCPYSCTYCYNSAYNQMFKECGQVLRRRSVASVIDEIKYLKANYPPVRMIRFADDTFAYRIDPWLLEFAKRYPKEIGLPFYCLMRPNGLTEEMVRILAEAGCISISMSVETGNERVRKEVLQRNISDETIVRSFEYTRKYKIRTQSNSMLAIPGTDTQQDFQTFLFAKKLKISVPTFGIFSPYPNTALTDYAVRKGLLEDRRLLIPAEFQLKSVLNNYTEEEKAFQIRLAWLGPLFCFLPDRFIPVLKLLLRINLDRLYSRIWSLYMIVAYRTRLFPYSSPRSPLAMLRMLADSLKYATRPK